MYFNLPTSERLKVIRIMHLKDNSNQYITITITITRSYVSEKNMVLCFQTTNQLMTSQFIDRISCNSSSKGFISLITKLNKCPCQVTGLSMRPKLIHILHLLLCWRHSRHYFNCATQRPGSIYIEITILDCVDQCHLFLITQPCQLVLFSVAMM